MPGGALAGHHLVDLQPDNVPDLVPDLTRRLPQRHRVALGSNRLTVGVVIETGPVGAPKDVHGVVGVEHQANDDA